jgi:hypothetical protein
MTRENQINGAAHSKRPVVKIIICRQIAVLDPPLEFVRSLLEYRCRTFVAEGPEGYRQFDGTVGAYGFDFKGRLGIPAGLLGRVLRALSERGYQWEIDDGRKDGQLWTIDSRVFDEAEPDEQSLLQACAKHFLGQIEVRSAADALTKITQVVRGFRKARFVIAVATYRDAYRVMRKLEHQLTEEVRLATGQHYRQGGRCIVTTFPHMPPVCGDDWDALLLPTAIHGTGDGVAYRIGFRSYPRVYGFVEPQRRVDEQVSLRLEAMAGPVIHHLAKPRVPVRVLMVPVPTREVQYAATALERKRILYWHNPTRNAFIAAIAKAIAADDQGSLQGLGVPASHLPELRQSRRYRVAVLVESPEHARQLMPLLKGWPLMSVVVATESVEAPSPKRRPRRAIMTTTYAATRGAKKADVVICATGTEWGLRIKQFPPRQDLTDQREVLVIDLADVTPLPAKTDTQRRIAEYVRRGIQVVQDPMGLEQTTKQNPPAGRLAPSGRGGGH